MLFFQIYSSDHQIPQISTDFGRGPVKLILFEQSRVSTKFVKNSGGEQFPFGVFVVLPDDHVLEFMMVTHKRGTAAPGKAAKGKAAKGKVAKAASQNTFTLNDIPDAVLRMITEMARTHFLPTVYEKLHGVRKLMGDSSA